MDAEKQIATELKIKPEQVTAALALLKEGAGIPFLARYRREKTGNLDERKLYALQDKLRLEDELSARRMIVLNSIKAQDKLTDDLKAKIDSASDKLELEDLYRPFGPQQFTLAKKAREQGLEPLAAILLKQEVTEGELADHALPFLSAEKGIKESSEAFARARLIVAEGLAGNSALKQLVVRKVNELGQLSIKAGKGVDLKKTRYKEFSGPVNKLHPNRLLPALRGIADKKLVAGVETPVAQLVEVLTPSVVTNPKSIFAGELVQALQVALEKLILPSIHEKLWEQIKARAESATLEQLGKSMRALLMQPPLGASAVLGIAFDARKTGAFAVLGPFGKVLHHEPFVLEKDEEKRKLVAQKIAKYLTEHEIRFIAVAHGNLGRATISFLEETLGAANVDRSRISSVLVNETGLVAYANSHSAKQEFSDLDLAARCAISIGRRLQDPLTELIKVNPKFLVTSLPHHNMDPKLVQRKLDEAVASCVTWVGVNLNAATARQLEYVPGIGPNLSKAILATHKEKGTFTSLAELLEVPGLSTKNFEQCAGYLRIKMGTNPLDDTGIHPEHYALVAKMAESVELDAKTILEHSDKVAKINLTAFKSDEVGESTLRDIQRELRVSGRDSRGTFVAPRFDSRVKEIKDIEVGQVITGMIAHHSSFGVFVDLGIREEGLIHVTELSSRFVHDQARFVPVGKVVKVKVVSVDVDKKRIGLSLKALEGAPRGRGRSTTQGRPTGSGTRSGATAERAGVAKGKSSGDQKGKDKRTGNSRGPAVSKEAAKYPTKSKDGKPLPDFSKFFQKGKKKERKRTGQKVEGGATRKDVQEVLRNQSSRQAPTLADLLKNAGVKSKE